MADRLVEGPTPPANHESANRDRAGTCGHHEPPPRTTVYEYAEGGFYVRQNEDTHNEVKTEDGSWQPAVHYRPVHFVGDRLYFLNRKMYTTTAARWAGRFTEVARG